MTLLGIAWWCQNSDLVCVCGGGKSIFNITIFFFKHDIRCHLYVLPRNVGLISLRRSSNDGLWKDNNKSMISYAINGTI